jgi:hypothetical protein
MNVLGLTVVPDPGDPVQNAAGAEELAWSHVMTLAGEGLEIGSEHFVQIHQQLLDAYRHCAAHFGFIQHMALRILKELLTSNDLHIRAFSADNDASEAVDSIRHLAYIIASSMMYMYASDSVAWIPNIEWLSMDEDVRGVTFLLRLEDSDEEGAEEE